MNYFFPNLSGQTILQVLPALEKGGVERGTVEMVQAIVSAGGKALVASQGGSLVSQILEVGGEHLTLPLRSKSPWGVWQNKKRLVTLCRSEGVTLVHARSRGPAWSAFGAVKELQIPWVTTFHGTYNFSNELKKFYNSIMVRGDRVIAISNFIQDHISLFYRKWVHPARVPVIYRGVDLKVFDPEKILTGDRLLLRQEWGIPKGTAVVLMAARFSRWKGHAGALKACEILKNHNFILVFAGKFRGRETYLSELEALAQKLEIREKVRFVECDGNMPQAYDAADLVLHASTDPEAFGRVVAEAQAMGKWTIVSSLGAPQEIILPHKTGDVIDPTDAQALAKALLKGLSLDQTQLKRVKEIARQRIADHFSLESMQCQTLNIYAELLGCEFCEKKDVA